MSIIGLLGADVSSSNYGVQALGLSLIEILHRIYDRREIPVEFVLFGYSLTPDSIQDVREVLSIPDVEISFHNMSFRKKTSRKELVSAICKCDQLVCITGGDSFSDIYGMRRFFTNIAYLQIADTHNVPYLFAPQTFGPFNSFVTKKLAKRALRKASACFSRDSDSTEIVRSMGIDNVKTVTDVAFFLPWTKCARAHEQAAIGLNVSGLLWSGGYTEENQFGLKEDYKTLMIALIDQLQQLGQYKIILVPHVITQDYKSIENDVWACDQLADLRPSCEVAPSFNNAIEAKTFISGLDVFLGSRMHATIAAFTSGVAVLPLAYSKKFEGLFGSLGYMHSVDLRSTSLAEVGFAVDSFIKNLSQVQKDQMAALAKADVLKRSLLDELEGALFNDR